ncbi:hypothetical protein PIB30_021568 [Stylosanthes scabra]|uniref:Zinc finger GRF-type domain-containing protein n=1 Tax=Stylosanthes scabra TaxID=79078 RepID=A0ABU6TAI3_9FABA|nr:hypothetical protein [Stylosanthes scabra]
MATEGRESTPISRDRAVGGEIWSTTSSHRGASSKKKRFVAPNCHCGTNAILFESCTEMNPNMLFFGCPHFNKRKESHCRYFYWLDEYVAIGHSDDSTKVPEVEDPLESIEKKMISLEKMIADLNNRMRCNALNDWKGIDIFLLGILFAFCLSLVLSSNSN